MLPDDKPVEFSSTRFSFQDLIKKTYIIKLNYIRNTVNISTLSSEVLYLEFSPTIDFIKFPCNLLSYRKLFL